MHHTLEEQQSANIPAQSASAEFGIDLEKFLFAFDHDGKEVQGVGLGMMTVWPCGGVFALTILAYTLTCEKPVWCGPQFQIRYVWVRHLVVTRRYHDKNPRAENYDDEETLQISKERG